MCVTEFLIDSTQDIDCLAVRKESNSNFNDIFKSECIQKNFKFDEIPD